MFWVGFRAVLLLYPAASAAVRLLWPARSPQHNVAALTMAVGLYTHEKHWKSLKSILNPFRFDR
jgi:hypothetical protein